MMAPHPHQVVTRCRTHAARVRALVKRARDAEEARRERARKTQAAQTAHPLVPLAICGAMALAPEGAWSMEIQMAPKGFDAFADQQLEAASVKCKGGMMDCDGDRREYAKKQMENFASRGTDQYDDACRPEEPCTSDFGAALQALNGMTSAEKLEKLGYSEEDYADRPNVFGKD